MFSKYFIDNSLIVVRYTAHILFPFLFSLAAFSQPMIIKGKVISEDGTPLNAASITVYNHGKISGSVSNTNGEFSINIPEKADSIRFSIIGYQSKITNLRQNPLKDTYSTIRLKVEVAQLQNVVIKSMNALTIINKAIDASQKLLPSNNFENHFFYREIIKDSGNYYSIAEAVFKSQYFPSEKNYKLKMEKGRSKEDVSYTRLFENYHPGGGPEEMVNKSFNVRFPDFLNVKKAKWFVYNKDSIISDGERKIYVIRFDQRQEVHEALDKGKIYIDANDFSIIRYESQNSPLGTAYVKNLTGTDKLFAELLHIDYKRKGWVNNVSFIKINNELLLSHAYSKYLIAYKQSTKNIDLNLNITTEMVVTDSPLPFEDKIEKGEEWKRKNLVANLPTDFDANFWGNANIISPTTGLDSVIAKISNKNNDMPAEKLTGNWQYYHSELFVAYQDKDSIIMVPVAKGAWKDDETAGMLYQTTKGDFIMETQLKITKRSDIKQLPDNGFQQAGIIIRDSTGKAENNIIFCIGTGGNDNPKYFLKKTEDGKSKGPVDKTDTMNGWLRFVKKGNTLNCFIKNNTESEWNKITRYQLKWLNKPVQAGIMVMAHFAASGPKAKPDMKATFTNFSLKTN